MKLKQLDISGFKSFADKTSVQFPLGICAVVGPNGCGKSNIVDALRWVMGEQSVKQLRGKSMEDIIFSGTEKKGPQNMAEVILTLVNDNGSSPEEYRDFSEIMVSRRLYRSGESQYFINKQPCRLKDIQNLLLGTGLSAKAYAIIEQGKIGALIDAGPEERRYFIEEAAGVTRYKTRKHEALLKIKRTEQNLLRINDVILEINRQMGNLKRQVRRAERFKSYQEELRNAEILLASQQYASLSEAIDRTNSLLQSLRDTDFQQVSELAKLDAAIEQIKQERSSKYQSISEQRTRREDLQRNLDRLEGDIEYRAKDLERVDSEIRELQVELESLEQKTDEIIEECQHLEARKTRFEEQISHAKNEVNREAEVQETLKNDVDNLTQSLETNKAQLIDLAGKKVTYENNLENAARNKINLSKRLDQLESEKEAATKELDHLDQEFTATQNRHLELKQTIEKTEVILRGREASLSQTRTDLGLQVRAVQTMEIERQKVRSQYNAFKKMDENYEWFQQGVQSVMQQWKAGKLEQAHIHGLVADVLQPEASYENAVEAALGEKLQYVVVEDQHAGLAAINTLRSLSGGRGSFVPLSDIRRLENKDIPSDSNGLDLLLHHVNVREGYEDVVHSLLSHVSVSDNIESALNWWRQQPTPWAVVTKDGNRISPQGILTGGSANSGAVGILTKKKELQELSIRVNEMTETLKEASARQQDLEMEAVSLEKQIQQTRHEQNLKNQQLVETEKNLYRIGEQKRHAARHLEILHLEGRQIEGERSDIEQEVAQQQAILEELAGELSALDERIQDTAKEREKALDRLETAKGTVVELRLQLTTLKAEYDSADNTLRRLKEFQRDRDEKHVRLKKGMEQALHNKASICAQLENGRARLSELYGELKMVEDVLNQREEEYQAIEGALQQNDQSVSEVRSRQQETNKKIQELELQQSERKIRRDHASARILEKYHQPLESLTENLPADGLSAEQLEAKLTDLRNKMASMGEVNLTAIEEYKELKARYVLLSRQRDDLKEAIDALYRVIRKINRISLKRFMKTFKAVDQKVQETFPKLFEGGQAKLALTTPRKPLESGVSYFVRPPGKKLTRMSLLSGGEKALAAITLVFSLFMIKPAAFCVLDEIDAPLDDVNTYRFNQLLAEIARQSQVVMITHDRQTMEAANALFGVTMEQKGISKLIALDLNRN
jgi:chromosome segregation protein